MQLIYDIETVANGELQAFIDAFPPKAKANLVDPVKIAADIEEKREEMAAKAGLHWTTGKVCCVTVGNNAGVNTFFGVDERAVLTDFFSFLVKVPSVSLIGKFNKHFDQPFLIGRAMVHDIGLPPQLRWDRPIGDIDEIFGGKWSDQSASLDKYAFALGLGRKLAHGSEVQLMYDLGKFTDIREYCEHDVKLCLEIKRRYDKVFHSAAPDTTGFDCADISYK